MAEIQFEEVISGKPGPSFLTGFRRLFYLVTPNETTFQTREEVPEYIEQATPFFIVMILVEYVVATLKKDSSPARLNDSIDSISAGIIGQCPGIFLKSAFAFLYMWLHENFRLLDLPWDSYVTWWTAFITVEFFYYWFHRMSHEVNLLWAAHQGHHSSEDYNFTTALRQSSFQRASIFMVPMALVVPPAAYFVHFQFNILYQFWLHTELVTSLGFLEYVLNTPSHHRVHHGRNPYCIDKNYGGTLIIFDRLFGTFAKEDEKVVYGLTHPLNTWDPIWLQVCHLTHIWKTFWATPGLTNKLSVLFKGPGWAPGKPRLGCIEDIPKVTYPEPKYDTQIPVFWSVYVAGHFAMAVIFYQELFAVAEDVTTLACLGRIAFLIWTLSSIAAIMDKKPSAAALDLSRCLAYVTFDVITRLWGPPAVLLPHLLMNVMLGMYLTSAVIQGVNILAPVLKDKAVKLE
ncbi:alkylglycerol monooxygenase-like [Branchiostoma lanceolatum]|uniref:alkylglycerol monooxygenase-like n=1 Tax=Branchiostoma lanceolatum TaxID=7740 RepID=UPI0034568DE3